MSDRDIEYEISGLLAQAMQYRGRGEMQKAQDLCKRAAILRPESADIQMCLGSLFLIGGELARAEESLRRATILNPRHAAAYNNLGIALHRMGDLDDAIRAFRNALQIEPSHVRAMRGLGSALNEVQAFVEAENILRRAIDIDPQDARCWDNLGYCLSETGRLEEAIGAYQRSLEFDSASAEVHNRLGVVRLKAGQTGLALEDLRRAAKMQPAFAAAHYNLGNALFSMNRLNESRSAYREALRLNPGYAEAHYNLGLVMQRLDQLPAAEGCFRKAIHCRSDYLQAHNSLGVVLLGRDQVSEAEKVLRHALTIDPANTQTMAHLALVYEQTGRLNEARTLAGKGLVLESKHPELNLVLAKCERREGRYQEAIRRLERIVPDIDEVSDMAAGIHYELGFLYDLTGDTVQAFRAAKRGNDVMDELWEPRRGESRSYARSLDVLANLFTRESVAEWCGTVPVNTQPDPVFLLGFPRSGTTLLDKVLDGHPQVVTLEEKDTVDSIERLLATCSNGYPASVAHLTAEQIQSARLEYYRSVNQYTGIDAGKLLVDKMPLNSAKAGLIWRIFPNAKFILALRHPCDVCLSCFRQNFHLNAAMAHFLTLEDTVRTYAWVMGLWQHYLDVLPITWHATRYEDLVGDLEQETRRILDFMGIEWNAEVLNYIENARSRQRINTPSYTQVTRPIYAHACYRWERYREFMEPYLDCLRPFMDRYGY
jgi:tetratricopeptide (TPR) repeat protein